MSALCAGWDVADGPGHRRRDAAQRRRPAGLRRGRLADRGAPPGRPRRGHRVRLAAPRWSSRSARCSAPTAWSPPGWRSSTAGTPARSTTTPTPRTRPRAIERLAAERGYDLARCFAYSDSVTDVPMLEAVGHPHAVNPDRELRREAVARGLAGAGVHPAGRAAQPDAAPAEPADARRAGRSAARRGGRRRRPTSAAPPTAATGRRTRPGPSDPCPAPVAPAYKGNQQLKTAREPGTHAANYPSYMGVVSGFTRGNS